MSILDWIFQRTPDIETDAPLVSITPPPYVPDTVDDEEQNFEIPVDGQIELEPVFTAIDYVDAKGIPSRRRVTLQRVKQGESALYLQAICHERRAFRSFRCDRIQCFIEPDGEVIDTREFFRKILLVDIDALTPAPDATPKQQRPSNDTVDGARRLREILRAPLSVLVAAARTDDEFHPEELEVIAVYIETEVLEMTRTSDSFQGVTVEVLDALLQLVERMRTQRSSLATYFNAIARMSAARRERFFSALRRLIEADGKVTFSEELFLTEITDFMHRGSR